MAGPNFELTFNEYLNSEQPEHQLLPICDEFQNSPSAQNINGSMNMDEFLKWMAEDNNDAQGTTTAATIPVQQQLNLQDNNASTQKPNYAQLAPPQQLQPPQHLPPLQYIPPQPPQLQRLKKRSSDGTSEEAEKRQQKMMKHRQTAAKNRAKKQAHVVELEKKLIQLTKENKQLLAWLENKPNFQNCEEEETTAKAPMQPKSPKANEKSTGLRRCFSSPY